MINRSKQQHIQSITQIILKLVSLVSSEFCIFCERTLVDCQTFRIFVRVEANLQLSFLSTESIM